MSDGLGRCVQPGATVLAGYFDWHGKYRGLLAIVGLRQSCYNGQSVWNVAEMTPEPETEFGECCPSIFYDADGNVAINYHDGRGDMPRADDSPILPFIKSGQQPKGEK